MVEEIAIDMTRLGGQEWMTKRWCCCVVVVAAMMSQGMTWERHEAQDNNHQPVVVPVVWWQCTIDKLQRMTTVVTWPSIGHCHHPYVSQRPLE
jgi:hypothetical protein